MKRPPSRTHDLLRLLALGLLFLAALPGRSRLFVDVENLAMKAVGTETAAVTALRDAEFENRPTLVLFASPEGGSARAGDENRAGSDGGAAARTPSPGDEVALQAWVESLKGRAEVAGIDLAPHVDGAERCVAVRIITDEAGRYADGVSALTAGARDSLPPGYSLAISGVPVVELAIAEALDHERQRILPLIGLVLACVLLLIYRSPVLVGGALLAPLCGVFLLEGVQGLLGIAIDPISALLGPAVLTVGVASSVHVLERYRAALALTPLQEPRGVGLAGTSAAIPMADSVAVASARAAHELRRPFVLALLTTVTGFLGLLASPIPAVQRFGLLASLGVVLAIGTTLLVLPSLLRLLHRPRRHADLEGARASLRHVHAIQRVRTSLLVVSALLCVLAVSRLGDLRIDSDPLHTLREDAPARRDAEELGRRLGGSQVFELFLPPAEEAPGLFGLAGLVSEVRALDGVVEVAGAPRRSEAGFLLLPFLMQPRGSLADSALFDRVVAAARSAGWPEADVTGLAVRMARDSNDLMRGLRNGLALTLAALWVVMAIGLRSWRLGLLGLIPNAMPLLLINGALAAAGAPLTVASTMIGTVMLGLVVDDTIHFLHAFQHTRGERVRRVARTLLSVRRPIVITTIVLSAGFSATLIGDLRPTREFGALAVATLTLAVFADLTLLPAMLLGRRRPRED